MKKIFSFLKSKSKAILALWGFLFIIGIVISIILVTPLKHVLSYAMFPDYPRNKSETLVLSELKQPVNIYFDDFGIPHIEAKNIIDLSLAVGFIQARYRFFQLDILRNFAYGKVSELLGNQKVFHSTTVQFDLAMRGWNFKKRAQQGFNQIPTLDKQMLYAFVSGVNSALKLYTPIEYRILGITPKPWTTEDSFVASILQAWSISHNWEQEAVRFSLALSLGLKKSQQIYPTEPLAGNTTIKKKGKRIKLPPAIVAEVKKLNIFSSATILQRQKRKSIIDGSASISPKKLNYALGDLAQIRPSASNAWVVSGKRSKSGFPLLANDMHLSHSLPSLIFLQHIKAPGLDAIGATLPGLPMIVAGHNKHVAWGATSAVADAIDLVIEKPLHKYKDRVMHDAKLCKLTHRKVTIKVKGEKSKIFTIRETCHGPVFNDMYPNFFPKEAPMVSIRWRTPGLTQALGHLLNLNKSKSLEELRSNLMKIPTPVQNIMAADIKGNIGFFTTGSVPIRKYFRGNFPVPGWLQKYEWSGWAKKNQMPKLINPKKGYIINTNNLIQSPYYRWPIVHIDSAPDFRIDAAQQRILKVKKHNQQSIQNIQTDIKVLRAKKIMPILLADLQTYKVANRQEKQALELLENWNFQATKRSVATAIFFTVYREATLMALKNKVNKGVLNLFVKQRYSTNVIDLWFNKSNHIIWDDATTEKKENREQIMHQAFKKTIQYLAKKHGKDIRKWQWGKLHYHQPSHMFGKKLSLFNLEKIPQAGSLDSVWKAHFNLGNNEHPFKSVAGPAFRFAIDLANINKAQFSNDTGESGWPLSPHYGDIYQKWKKGLLVPMIYNWPKIRELYGKSKRLMLKNK